MKTLLFATALVFASMTASSGTWEDWILCAGASRFLMGEDGISVKEKHELALKQEVMAVVGCSKRQEVSPEEKILCTNGSTAEMAHEAYLVYRDLSPSKQVTVAVACSEYFKSASTIIEELCKDKPSDRLCR